MQKFMMGFVYAFRGIAQTLGGELNFKVMLAVAALAVGLGFTQHINRLEWVAVVICIGMVLGLEMMNTAGERLIDILCPDHDPRYGRIKDILAGAVLIAAVAAGVVGVLVFFT